MQTAEGQENFGEKRERERERGKGGTEFAELFVNLHNDALMLPLHLTVFFFFIEVKLTTQNRFPKMKKNVSGKSA